MYKYKPFTEALPEVVQRYATLKTKEDQDKFNKSNPEWMESQEVSEYNDKKRKAHLENEANKQFLQETCKWLQSDKPRLGKVRQVLAQYPTAKVTVEPVTVDWNDQG